MQLTNETPMVLSNGDVKTICKFGDVGSTAQYSMRDNLGTEVEGGELVKFLVVVATDDHIADFLKTKGKHSSLEEYFNDPDAYNGGKGE